MDEKTRASIVTSWHEMLRAVASIGGRADPLCVEPPATEDEIVSLERKLAMPLPHALKDTLLTFSRKVEFRWFLPDDYQVSDELSEIFRGGCHWSLQWLEQFDSDRRDWITKVFPDPTNAYDAVWHHKLAFHEVGNGDYLSIDVAQDSSPAVVYLSHDDGQGHGRRLGADFQDFLMRWTRLGCVGAEDWQWLPFAPGDGFLDPDCDRARDFRKRVGANL